MPRLLAFWPFIGRKYFSQKWAHCRARQFVRNPVPAIEHMQRDCCPGIAQCLRQLFRLCNGSPVVMSAMQQQGLASHFARMAKRRTGGKHRVARPGFLFDGPSDSRRGDVVEGLKIVDACAEYDCAQVGILRCYHRGCDCPATVAMKNDLAGVDIRLGAQETQGRADRPLRRGAAEIRRPFRAAISWLRNRSSSDVQPSAEVQEQSGLNCFPGADTVATLVPVNEQHRSSGLGVVRADLKKLDGRRLRMVDLMLRNSRHVAPASTALGSASQPCNAQAS